MRNLSSTPMTRFSASLVLPIAVFASATASAVTIKDFTLVNTSATAADDLTVTLNQPVSTVRSNRIFDNARPPADTGNKFNTSTAVMPSRFQVKYTNPTNGQTVATGGSTHITLETEAAQLKGKSGFQVDPNPNLTFFTIGGNPVPPPAGSKSSVRLVSANVDITRDPNTAVVSASISNPTDDFIFLGALRIYTGLTAAQAQTFDANNDFVTSLLPATPSFALGDVALTPMQALASPILLGNLPLNSFVVALFDLADGASSNLGDAIPYGRFFVSTDVAAVPEPGNLALLGVGLSVLLAARLRKRKNG
jgi:PEP-CTERM motif